MLYSKPLPMYVRTREDALEALSLILELPDRASQIIEVTMRIALCLDPAPRRFLMDCQAALIQGGLEALRRRRLEQLASLARKTPAKTQRRPSLYVIPDEPPEPILIPETEEPKPQPPPPQEAPALSPDMLLDPLLEEIGAALDLLKMVEITGEVFPKLVAKFPRWRLARFVADNEEQVRSSSTEALKNYNRPERRAEIEQALREKIADTPPFWAEWADSLRETCKQAIATLRRMDAVHPKANDPDLLFTVIAMSEERARTLLNALTGSPSEAVAYVAEIRLRVNWIAAAEQEE